MEILHRRGRATVAEIRAELPKASSPSSVRKLLEIMMTRGHVSREQREGAFEYRPASRPEEVRKSALKNLLRTFFNDSPGSAVAALLDASDTRLSEAEYERLAQLLKSARRRDGKRGRER